MRKLPSINEIELLIGEDADHLRNPDELRKLLSEYEFSKKAVEIAIDILMIRHGNNKMCLVLLEEELKTKASS